MRKITRVLIFSIVLFISTHHAFSQLSETVDAINWTSNLDYAKLIAQRYNKPVFLFFVDVPPNAISKSVYNSTLANNIVANKVNDDFVPVRVLGDSIVEDSYNVTRFPTLLILSPNDFTEISRLTGIMSADSVFSLLQNALELTGESLSSAGLARATLGGSGRALVYEYEGGAFIYLGDNNWVHSTSLYPRINFVQFHKDDVHYYIANRELNVYFALPQKEAVFWVLKKGKRLDSGSTEDAWLYAGKIDRIANGSLEAYIAENTIIQQEN